MWENTKTYNKKWREHIFYDLQRKLVFFLQSYQTITHFKKQKILFFPNKTNLWLLKKNTQYIVCELLKISNELSAYYTRDI